MPAIRTKKYEADFQEVDAEPTKVKSIACSAASDTEDVLILKSGRKAHLTRQKHLDAVALNPPLAASSAATVSVNHETRISASGQQPKLTLAEMFADSSSDDEASDRHRAPSPLDDIMMDGNRFFDSARDEILFSAGTEEDLGAQRQELLEGIRNLDYNDETVFGKMGWQTNMDEDLTISNAVAAMTDLGERRAGGKTDYENLCNK